MLWHFTVVYFFVHNVREFVRAGREKKNFRLAICNVYPANGTLKTIAI